MPRASSVEKLPVSIVEELNQRLRSNAYGPLDAFVEWLDSMDYTVSRSALGRYMKRLSLSDARRGGDLAQVLLTKVSTNRSKHHATRIFQITAEMTELHSRQKELLTELASLTGAN